MSDAPVTTFERAAWYLRDFADLQRNIMAGDDSEEDQQCIANEAELLALAEKLEALKLRWEARVGSTGANNAACIVSAMLAEWKLPGAVWYLPSARRFRITAEGYEPSDGEVCVGVYLPGAASEILAEDFEQVLS